MTDQLYRWVKASERNPPSHPDNKHNIRYIEGNGWGKDLKGVAKYVGRWVDDAHGSVADSAIEWLEPIPIPSPGDNQSLEEAAADYAKDCVGEYDPELQDEFDDVKRHFMNGGLHERADESQLKRLYDWIMDENRKGAIFAFTSGCLRNVAKEIEFRIAGKGGEEK